MDQRVEQLEQAMASLSTGQQGILSQMTEMFDQLTARVEQIATQTGQESGDNSRAPSRGNGGRNNGQGGFQHPGSTSSYAPKLVKLDFPRFKGGEDPTSWLCRAEQFFQFHETPEVERVSLASFHLEGNVQLWYQLLRQEMAAIT
eukprot:TRINITY_DN10847_c0_g2_i2.p2 TRINITY_DN10847_c0_g2~~TRINITY_DN10847_c0_g2_i2.p2  ORF type:complete len:145 (+),score=23.88 TRINITY_DN10847_c0_g2_i2:142-576(+)